MHPVGQPDFKNVRADGALYVDRTALIYRMETQGRCYFLIRPRRFGMSLLVSTLETYFEGLEMARLEKDWTQHPVLHVDFSEVNYLSAGRAGENAQHNPA